MSQYYQHGIEIDQNLNKAFDLLKCLEPFEYPPALVALGEYYLQHQPTEYDTERLFTIAAKSKNYANGYYELGVLSENDDNSDETISYFHIAALLGSGDACYELYRHYKPIDKDKSRKWCMTGHERFEARCSHECGNEQVEMLAPIPIFPFDPLVGFSLPYYQRAADRGNLPSLKLILDDVFIKITRHPIFPDPTYIIHNQKYELDSNYKRVLVILELLDNIHDHDYVVFVSKAMFLLSLACLVSDQKRNDFINNSYLTCRHMYKALLLDPNLGNKIPLNLRIDLLTCACEEGHQRLIQQFLLDFVAQFAEIKETACERAHINLFQAKAEAARFFIRRLPTTFRLWLEVNKEFFNWDSDFSHTVLFRLDGPNIRRGLSKAEWQLKQKKRVQDFRVLLEYGQLENVRVYHLLKGIRYDRISKIKDPIVIALLEWMD